MAILSFHPVKHITTGEGGAITTNDAKLAKNLRDLRTHGITKDPAVLERHDGPWYYEQHALGYNYRITDLQCALGISQLKKLSRFVARRLEIAALYDRLLTQTSLRELVNPLTVHSGRRSSYHLYVITLRPGLDETNEQLSERRRKVFMSLHARGIKSQVHYIPVPWQPFYRKSFGFRFGQFPRAERYYAGCLSLPMFPKMSDSDVERVVEVLRESCLENRCTE
jgi:dTDP-4-amino-4,6-dideoxygalactose transaminase